MKNLAKKSTGSDFLMPERYFHSYNRTNNKEILFKTEKDNFLFLNIVHDYLSPYIDIIAFNLIPNHFHFIYEVRKMEDIKTYLLELKVDERVLGITNFLSSEMTFIDLDALICNQFRRAFISYAKRINKSYRRKGNLFYKHFKTKLISNRIGVKRAIRYVNLNSIKHGITIPAVEYKWTSYRDYLIPGESLINREKGLLFFDDFLEFKTFHLKYYSLIAREKALLKKLQSCQTEILL
jgi:REP element-mobilizing transposase RayT